MRDHEFAEQIGVAVETWRRWNRTEKLKTKRTPKIPNKTLLKLQKLGSVLNHVKERTTDRNRS